MAVKPEVRTGAPIWALGLMSGTSMDGIDAALIKTDGETVFETGPFAGEPYDADFRARLAAAVTAKAADEALVAELTARHAAVVQSLLDQWGGTAAVIGFHGHTLFHRPERGQTRQIGDGAHLARATGLAVVNDFRSADMAAGGEGAPFAPLYHRARLEGAGIEGRVAILNLGGVANVTLMGAGVGDDGILAFDTGPGCGFIDDWVAAAGAGPYDRGGKLAAAGVVDGAALGALMDNPWFHKPPPKSLDRFGFDLAPIQGLSLEDGAATLGAFTAQAVARGVDHFPPGVDGLSWFATGGGRHNPVLMAAIGDAVGAAIRPVEALGWNGDALEAEAFAFLAVRSLRGLPLSVPGTTGVTRPVTGGVVHLSD